MWIEVAWSIFIKQEETSQALWQGIIPELWAGEWLERKTVVLLSADRQLPKKHFYPNDSNKQLEQLQNNKIKREESSQQMIKGAWRDLTERSQPVMKWKLTLIVHCLSVSLVYSQLSPVFCDIVSETASSPPVECTFSSINCQKEKTDLAD